MRSLLKLLGAFCSRAIWLPRARFVRPDPWTETDKTNLAVFLATPTGLKFVSTMHALVSDRALSVCERSKFEFGITGGMSLLLGEIERMAVEGEPETFEMEKHDE